MDFLDLFALLPMDLPGSRSRSRTPGENLTGAIGLVLLPFLDFVIVLFGDVWKHPAVAVLVLPLAFAAASLVLSRLLQMSTGWAAVVALGCAALSLLAGGIALVLGVFASFYSAF